MFLVGTLARYINNWIYPQPPANAAYGYHWQAGQGVPNQLQIYDLANAAPGPGVYVVFNAALLDALVDPFGRGMGGPGTVFPVPLAPSAAMTTLINNVRHNPPPGEAALFNNVTQQRLADLSSFLSYTGQCLDIIDHTAAGHQLFQNLGNAIGPVFISPATMGGNQTFAGGPNYVNQLTVALRDYSSNGTLDSGLLRPIIDAHYAATQGTLARYNQLADDLNNLPLYSLFLRDDRFPPNFLKSFFRFRGRRFTGQNLMNWLSTGGFSAFDLNMRTFARSEQGVLVRTYFLLALNIVLYPSAPAGTGAGAGVKFNTRNEGDNVLGSADFRPPAVGLSHELMHAMHYGHGTAPGFDIGHFTTTSAELLFAGIGPFANQAVTENAIRGQWGTIPGPAIDASNVWAAPALRRTYEPPPLGTTPATMRAQMRCI